MTPGSVRRVKVKLSKRQGKFPCPGYKLFQGKIIVYEETGGWGCVSQGDRGDVEKKELQSTRDCVFRRGVLRTVETST